MPSLVQIMACRLFGDKPLSEPIMVHHKFIIKTPRNIFQWSFICNLKVFIQEISFEDVAAKMGAILFWPQCVNNSFVDSSNHKFYLVVAQWCHMTETQSSHMHNHWKQKMVILTTLSSLVARFTLEKWLWWMAFQWKFVMIVFVGKNI